MGLSTAELTNSIIVLDAINFRFQAVQNVSSKIKQRCFLKADFSVQLDTVSASNEEIYLNPTAKWRKEKIIQPMIGIH